MQMMAKINAKLDIGWKLTTMSCPSCNSTTMAEPNAQIDQVYCPKCDKKYPVESQSQEEHTQNTEKKDQDLDEESNFYQQVYQNYSSSGANSSLTSANAKEKTQRNEFQLLKTEQLAAPFKKSNDVSKKIGEKLLQGWTMLNQSCMDCLAPLMQSKKGEKICCGCNKNFANASQNNKVAQVEKADKTQKVEKKENAFKKNDQASTKNNVTGTKNKDIANNSVDAFNQVFSRIELKSLEFIQKKVDRAIEDNDVSQLQRLLSLAYKIKGQFK